MNQQQLIESNLFVPAPKKETKRPAGLWFGWWVAACLLLLAVSSYQQLQIQRRILAQSRELKLAVAQAAVVSAATNQQLSGVGKLDASTARLAAQLQKMVKTNAAIKAELAAIEGNAQAIGLSVVTLDQVTQESAVQLAAIARKSDDLQSVLGESLATGRKAASMLDEMVRVQNEVTGNLGAMVQKTTLLQRFVKGD